MAGIEEKKVNQLIMKKIIIFVFFSAFIFSGQLSLAAYPATCPDLAQSILGTVGGCSAIDRAIYSNVYDKCCVSSTQTQACTSFSYSNWSVCQPNNTQTRTVVSKSPTGCTGGTPITSQSCTPTIVPAVSTSATSTPTALISTFISSKNEIASGEAVVLIFSGPSAISKYKIYFSCPKFSTGLNAGLLAASAKIGEVEYCNKDFSVPANIKTQTVAILSKYSKPLKITARLKAYNSQEEYVDYKDVILTVSVTSAITSTPVLSTSTAVSVTTSVPTPVSTMPTGTSLQEQINLLLDKIKALQQQISQRSSSAPATSLGASNTSVVPTSSSAPAPAPAGESLTESALSNESAIFSHTWNDNLYYGMRNNDDVKALQKALIKEGVYSGEATGNFFGITRQAVIDFQKKNNFTNVPGTGYVGTYTRKALNDLYSK